MARETVQEPENAPKVFGESTESGMVAKGSVWVKAIVMVVLLVLAFGVWVLGNAISYVKMVR